MSCDKYIEWISAALDGELTAEERRELDDHLAVCPSCAALFEELSAQSRTLRDLDCPFPAGLHDRIMNNLPPQEVPAKKNNIIHWKRWGSLAACLVLVIALGTFARFGLRMGSSAPMAESASGGTANSHTKSDTSYLSEVEAPQQESASAPVISYSKVHYLHVDWHEDMAAPSATVITNTDSLALYLNELQSPNDNGAEDLVFESVLETYSAEFFADRSLLLVLLEENSGSIAHEIKSVTGDNVIIHRVVPEVGTCDMAAWLLVVELDEILDGGSILTVEFIK